MTDRPAQTAWHARDVPRVLADLRTDGDRGLSAGEAAARLERHGPNALEERGGKGPWRILWEQLTATMVLVLLAAAAASAALKDFKDAVAILAIVALNSALGFFQENKAEKAMAALKRMSVPLVKARRDGRTAEVSSRDLVPGDVVLLEAGGVVPADGRVTESAGLRAQEAALTGESEAVDKTVPPLAGDDLPLGDRTNMAFMGTAVAAGRGRMIVTATGMATELGGIAAMIQETGGGPTPLQKRLDRLAKQLALAALAVVALVFAMGLARGEDLRTLFLTAVGLAVAAVPEGLPAVVTIALALGAQRMMKRRALIRKLPAVETLGSVTVICSDKTGTLTQNRMTVTVIDVAGRRVDLPADGDGGARADREPSPVSLLLFAGALCNDADLDGDRAVGDPTEGALLVAARRLGLDPAALRRDFPRVAELAFDSDRKRMTTVHRAPARPPAGLDKVLAGRAHVAVTKGAVDGLLEVSNAVWTGDRAEPLDEAWRERVLAANRRMAEGGMRVLGVALRPWDGAAADLDGRNPERELLFVGLFGMVDPPRPEARDAVAVCRAAGIRPIMITGDHPLTAVHIAKALGIAEDDGILTGRELGGLSAEALEEKLKDVSVFARVAPEHKLKIVEALQRLGHNVAMTGDGVNDAPALKAADIGVAMGITGTDVSKEASDMVLLDDNFATIVAAVEEGRAIYDNIRKFIKYLLTTNFAEVLVMLAAPLLGMPLPLLPLQILWINLVTDGPTALTLGVEPAEKDVMRRPPRRAAEGILARGTGWHVLWAGLLMTAATLGTGWAFWKAGRDEWQTVLFTTMALCQMGHVLAIRSDKESLFRQGFRGNPWIAGAVAVTVALQLALVYVPALRTVFGTAALGAPELLAAAGASSVVFIGVEVEKAVRRRRGR